MTNKNKIETDKRKLEERKELFSLLNKIEDVYTYVVINNISPATFIGALMIMVGRMTSMYPMKDE